MDLSRKSDNSSVKISDYPRRNKKILPNFHFILPNFHFILPNFYFRPPWKIFVCSLTISDFLERDCHQRKSRSHTKESL